MCTAADLLHVRALVSACVPQHCRSAASTLLRLQVEAEASHNPAELMLHVGDLSYGDGDPEVWDSFLESLSPFAGRVPYMIAVG